MNAVKALETRKFVSPVSSDPLVHEAERVLSQSGYVALRKLNCACSNGVVSLSGNVPSFFLKQMAQTLVAQLKGVRRVDNQVKVR